MKVPVEQIKPGRVLALPGGNTRQVVRVDRYEELDGDAYVVIYSDVQLHSWEGRSGVSNKWKTSTIDDLEKSLRIMRKGELVEVAA